MENKLNPRAMGLTFGILWSLGLLFMSIIALFSDSYMHNITEFMSTIYIGYELTPIGIPTGMIWAFLDAGIGGYVFVWVYNKIL